ncbi:MAG: hypothetical protein XD82_1734, partial [Methanoculleus marisnigri]
FTDRRHIIGPTVKPGLQLQWSATVNLRAHGTVPYPKISTEQIKTKNRVS